MAGGRRMSWRHLSFPTEKLRSLQVCYGEEVKLVPRGLVNAANLCYMHCVSSSALVCGGRPVLVCFLYARATNISVYSIQFVYKLFSTVCVTNFACNTCYLLLTVLGQDKTPLTELPRSCRCSWPALLWSTFCAH